MIKLIKIFQYITEYLLFTQQNLEDKLKTKDMHIVNIVDKITESENIMLKYKAKFLALKEENLRLQQEKENYMKINYVNIKNHIEEKHKDKVNDILYNCNICTGKWFESEDKLEKHYARRHNNAPFFMNNLNAIGNLNGNLNTNTNSNLNTITTATTFNDDYMKKTCFTEASNISNVNVTSVKNKNNKNIDKHYIIDKPNGNSNDKPYISPNEKNKEYVIDNKLITKLTDNFKDLESKLDILFNFNNKLIKTSTANNSDNIMTNNFMIKILDEVQNLKLEQKNNKIAELNEKLVS